MQKSLVDRQNRKRSLGQQKTRRNFVSIDKSYIAANWMKWKPRTLGWHGRIDLFQKVRYMAWVQLHLVGDRVEYSQLLTSINKVICILSEISRVNLHSLQVNKLRKIQNMIHAIQPCVCLPTWWVRNENEPFKICLSLASNLLNTFWTSHYPFLGP